MSDDFEHILEENRCLKKDIQILRYQNDKIQNELADIRFSHQELLDKNIEVNHSYNQLQKKYQLQGAEHNKDIATLTSQIEELKLLIEQKQQQMENFQIKMIPNLDQDMIRVKLIAQMEGPYQESIEKKDREISRLKQKLTELERKLNLTDLQLNSKEKEFKRELSQTKTFYQNQNEKLLKELNMVLNKKDIKSYDKEVFKSQRKELEQLRYTINLQEQNQIDLRKQLAQIKIEKEKYLLQICQLNEKKALQLHLSSDSAEIRALKEEKKRFQDEILRKNDQIERLQKKIKNIEKEFKINEEEIKKTHQRNIEKWEHDKELLIEQLRKEKDENRRAHSLKENKEDDYDRVSQTLKNMEKELQLKKNQCERLKETISDLQKQNRELQIVKKRKLSLTKDIIDQKKKVQEETSKKQNNNKLNNEIQKDKYTKDLEKINSRLKQKLQLANRKIVQLLHQKVHSKSHAKNKNANDSFSRQRAFSNIQIQPKPGPTNDIMLEYRDASLTPLVPPTIYTRQKK